MSYLSKEDAIFAIKKMRNFHRDLQILMSQNGLDLLEDLGRRNILMSAAQEKYFSEALGRKYLVSCDGRTGEPDIMIKDLNKELECKITSPHKSGAISFQTDYATLLKKEKLDYLYVVADRDFESFAVIHYTDLSVDDFRSLSSGARGKTQMKKYAAHDRASVLLGGLESINKQELFKLRKKLEKASTQSQKNKINKSIKYWTETPTKFRVKMEALND